MATRASTDGAVISTRDLHWPPGSIEARLAPATDPELSRLAEDFANDRIRVEGIRGGHSFRFEEQSLLKLGDTIHYRDIEPPSPDKGALWAVAPDSPERGDVLLFSRYPTQVPYSLSANIASEDVAGRSFPTMQHLGAKGVKINLDLLFYDAWIDIRRYSAAAVAKLWFDMYVIGHDGTGASVPFAHIYLQIGNTSPVRVMIHEVELITSMFNRKDEPQSVEAKVQLSVWEPVYLVSPFKPKSPPVSRRVKEKALICVTPDVLATLCGQNAGVNITQSANAQALSTAGIIRDTIAAPVVGLVSGIRRAMELDHSPAE